MRTTFVALALSALALSASAQEMAATADGTELKPGAGANNLEVQFTPLGGSPISIAGIRYRHFTSPLSAFRANMYVGYSRTAQVTQDEDTKNGNDKKELNKYNSTFDLGIRPGIERHFTGTRRLSPYVGAELDLFYRYTRETSEFQVGSDVKEEMTKNKDGFFRVGVNAVAGFDFYIAKHIYLGAELGFGIAYKRASTKVVVPSEGDQVETRDGSKNEVNFGPNVVQAIRLGFIF